MESGLTTGDLALMDRNNNMWGTEGGAFMWIFALLILAGGSGFGWGNRGGDYGQYATAASQQEILFGQQFQNLENRMDRGFTSIGNGIADATFAINNSIKDGQYNISGTVVNEGRALQTQIANCCCDNKTLQLQNKYELSNAIHAEGEATRALLQQNKIETLQGRINQLEMQNAMCGVVRYPMQTTFNSGANPFCNCNCGAQSF